MTGSVLAMAIASIALATNANAGQTHIAVNDDFFDDDEVTSIRSLPVIWEWGTPINSHNVRQDRKVFASGAPTTDDNFSFARTVNSGTYPYFCTTHGSPSGGGMSGVLRITPLGLAEGNDFRVTWGDSSGVPNQFDVRFRVNGGKWRSWKKDTKRTTSLFGKRGKPVEFNPNKHYDVQVRGEVASNPKRHGTFSPSLEFGAPI